MRHVNNRNLVVHGRHSLTGQKRVVNYPLLGERLLRVVSRDLIIRSLVEGCREEIKAQLVSRIIFINDCANQAIVFADD